MKPAQEERWTPTDDLTAISMPRAVTNPPRHLAEKLEEQKYPEIPQKNLRGQRAFCISDAMVSFPVLLECPKTANQQNNLPNVHTAKP